MLVAAASCYFLCHRNGGGVRERLKKLLCVPFNFSNRGSHVVVYEPEEVYDNSLVADRCLVYG